MKAYVFSCNAHPATKAVSVQSQGTNLPDRPCADGEWIPSGHLDLTGVKPGVSVPGIDMEALRSDLEKQGWHVFAGSGEDSAFDISYL